MRLEPDYGLPPIMTAEEVAEFLRTCTETVHRMARAGNRYTGKWDLLKPYAVKPGYVEG
jgi:hypothetical protein